MKKVIVFSLVLMLFASCKSKGDSQKDESVVAAHELRVISGKVIDNSKKKIPFAAVKLYLDDDDCMSAYTDNDGSFEFKVDELRIKDQTHFEIVYKGYAINMLSLRNFKDGGSIILDKKGKVVPAADYHVFYESIKSCEQNK